MIVLSCYRNVIRCFDWKDNHTLFIADVQSVPFNAKANLNAGLAYVEMAQDLKSPDKEQRLDSAKKYLQTGIKIYPEFLDGYLSTWGAPIECAEWDKIPAFIHGDNSRLEQLLDKLLDNAKSFCAENGRVLVSIERSQKHIKVCIDNDGPLLTSFHTEDLFSPMVSTRSSGSSIHLGLGLHIAKLIADQHKAKLEGKNRGDKKGKQFVKNTKKAAIGRFWKTSKYIEADFKEDLEKLIEVYSEKGHRDARVLDHTLTWNDDNTLNLNLKICLILPLIALKWMQILKAYRPRIQI